MVDSKAKAKIDLEIEKAKLKIILAKKRHAELEEPIHNSNSWEHFFD